MAKRKNKNDFQTYHDALTEFKKVFKNKEDYVSTDEKYIEMVNDTKPYLSCEIEKELHALAHIKKTGFYITNFYDPWYSSGYYLNSCSKRLSRYKAEIDKYYFTEDIPDVYYEIPELKEYPSDLIIGLKGFYKEILEMEEYFYNSEDFRYIREHLVEYLSLKYEKKPSFCVESQVLVPRVEYLHEIIKQVDAAGGIDAVESGNYPDLKLSIRSHCSPVSKEYYRRCLGLRYEFDKLMQPEIIHSEEPIPSTSDFVERIKNMVLPTGQLSLFDLGLSA